MPLTVLIPWRPQPSRVEAFDAVIAWYRANFGDVDIRTVDCDDNIFNLAQCRNLGIASIEDAGQVVIINDADTVPEIGALREAVEAAATSGRVHLPYTAYHWLGADGTAQMLAGRPLNQPGGRTEGKMNAFADGASKTRPGTSPTKRCWANHPAATPAPCMRCTTRPRFAKARSTTRTPSSCSSTATHQ
jgi:hypothetical protein